MRLIFVLMLVACTSSSGSREVTITTRTPPTFIVVRNDGDATWVAPFAVDATTFRFTPTGAYRITVSCPNRPELAIEMLFQVARTLDDDPRVDLNCGYPVLDSRVNTTMVQPGGVAVANVTEHSDEANWPVTMAARTGANDLVAFSSDRGLIRRNIMAAGETEIPPIDLARDGVALVKGTLAASNAESDERLSSLVTLDIEDTFTTVHEGDPTAARFFPSSVIDGDVRQYAHVYAERGNGGARYVDTEHVGAAMVTLPAPLDRITFTHAGHDISASWPVARPGAVFLAVVAFASSKVWFHHLHATAAYAETLGTQLTFEIDNVPNVPASLLFDVATADHTRILDIVEGAVDEDQFGVSASQSFNTTAVRQARFGREWNRMR